MRWVTKSQMRASAAAALERLDDVAQSLRGMVGDMEHALATAASAATLSAALDHRRRSLAPLGLDPALGEVPAAAASASKAAQPHGIRELQRWIVVVQRAGEMLGDAAGDLGVIVSPDEVLPPPAGSPPRAAEAPPFVPPAAPHVTHGQYRPMRPRSAAAGAPSSLRAGPGSGPGGAGSRHALGLAATSTGTAVARDEPRPGDGHIVAASEFCRGTGAAAAAAVRVHTSRSTGVPLAPGLLPDVARCAN